MAVNPELLLFIEPENAPSEEPVIDVLTKKMTASFRKAKKGAIKDYSKIGHEYKFIEDDGWMGFHNCFCGAKSGGQDFLLPNGEMTNENCIHYLAYHRDEIPQEQIARVYSLDDGQEIPSSLELDRHRAKWTESVSGPMSRQEYLDFLSKRNFD